MSFGDEFRIGGGQFRIGPWSVSDQFRIRWRSVSGQGDAGGGGAS